MMVALKVQRKAASSVETMAMTRVGKRVASKVF